MNILVGESTQSGGNYSLFTETQVLSLVWQAEPVYARLTSIRDGQELTVMRSGQVMRTTVSETLDTQGNEVVTTQSVPDAEKTVAKAVEIADTFKEAVAMLGKTKVVDRSDLNSLNIAKVLNAAPEDASQEASAEDEGTQ